MFGEVIGLAGQRKRLANLLQLAIGDNRSNFEYPRRSNIGRRILHIHPDKEAGWKRVVRDHGSLHDTYYTRNLHGLLTSGR